MTRPAPDALDVLVNRWRAAVSGRFVPSFDPDSGRTEARVLVLMERPAADTVARGDDAVSSEDNPNPSSRAFRHARIASGITRRDYLRWNMIPWADHCPLAMARTAELDSARDGLHELLTALPLLRSIVTLGQPALDGVMRYFTLHDNPVIRTVLAAPHPSPANGRHRAEQHVRIVAALSRAIRI